MSNFKLSLEERETVLLINDVPGSTWDVWTCSDRWVKKLKKAGYAAKKDHQGGWSCSIPMDRIRILQPGKRKLTEKQQQNILKARAARKSIIAVNKPEDQNPMAGI